jgi:hypothetical protein
MAKKKVDPKVVSEKAAEFIDSSSDKPMIDPQAIKRSMTEIFANIGSESAKTRRTSNRVTDKTVIEMNRRRVECIELMKGLRDEDDDSDWIVCAYCSRPLIGGPPTWLSADGERTCTSATGHHLPKSIPNNEIRSQ